MIQLKLEGLRAPNNQSVRLTVYNNDIDEFYCWTTIPELTELLNNLTDGEKIIKVYAGTFLGFSKSIDDCLILAIYKIGANTQPGDGTYNIDINDTYYNKFIIKINEFKSVLLDLEFSPLENIVKIEG